MNALSTNDTSLKCPMCATPAPSDALLCPCCGSAIVSGAMDVTELRAHLAATRARQRSSSKPRFGPSSLIPLKLYQAVGDGSVPVGRPVSAGVAPTQSAAAAPCPSAPSDSATPGTAPRAAAVVDELPVERELELELDVHLHRGPRRGLWLGLAAMAAIAMLALAAVLASLGNDGARSGGEHAGSTTGSLQTR